jgi:hypothetical protein
MLRLTSRPTASWPVRLDVGHPFGVHGQIFNFLMFHNYIRSSLRRASSLRGGRVCSLQCNNALVRVTQNSRPYFTVSSETPPTWRARSLYLYPPGTGWPSYTPGRWVLFCRLLRLGGLRWRYPLCLNLKLKLIYDRQSVGLGFRRPSGTRDQFLLSP